MPPAFDLIIFFFSSRRRHPWWPRDWSSDVCSSDLGGVAFAAWTLAAFAIGALAGMLIRRVVPAIVATLAAYTGLALVAGNLLRQHYLTPLVTSNPNVPGSALVLSQWWTHGGKFAFAGQPPNDLLIRLCPNAPAGVFGHNRMRRSLGG